MINKYEEIFLLYFWRERVLLGPSNRYYRFIKSDVLSGLKYDIADFAKPPRFMIVGLEKYKRELLL